MTAIYFVVEKVKTFQTGKFIDSFFIALAMVVLLFVVHKFTSSISNVVVVSDNAIIIPGQSIKLNWSASKEDWIAAYNEYKRIKGVKSDTH
jgi:hypothetical protein